MAKEGSWGPLTSSKTAARPSSAHLDSVAPPGTLLGGSAWAQKSLTPRPLASLEVGVAMHPTCWLCPKAPPTLALDPTSCTHLPQGQEVTCTFLQARGSRGPVPRDSQTQRVFLTQPDEACRGSA